MNTRIRYSKEADGSFISMKVITSTHHPEWTGSEWRATISADGKTGTIVNLSTGATKIVGGTSAHKTKIAIKKALEDVGCEFEIETRNKEY